MEQNLLSLSAELLIGVFVELDFGDLVKTRQVRPSFDPARLHADFAPRYAARTRSSSTGPKSYSTKLNAEFMELWIMPLVDVHCTNGCAALSICSKHGRHKHRVVSSRCTEVQALDLPLQTSPVASWHIRMETAPYA